VTAPRAVAVVSGGLGAIGTAVCRELASGLGLAVVALDLPADGARYGAFVAALAGFDARHIACDVALEQQCADAIARIEVEVGPIEVLVNNAGITRDSTLRNMTREQWDQVRAVNYDGLFNLTRPALEPMLARGRGRIVNISSVVGQSGAFGQTNYAAAKAATHGFTMALAREVARKGITVNCVSPGYVRSPMTDAMPEAVRTQVLASVPAGRIGEPADIARAVAFLCAPEASYLTGVNLPVNGGLFIS